MIFKMMIAGCFLTAALAYTSFQKNKPAIPFLKTSQAINDSSFDGKLPEYKIDACLQGFLESVVQSNTNYYNPDAFFYSLLFGKGKRQRYMSITPDLWLSSKAMDYSGVIRVGKAKFLCHGDFKSDSLFRKEEGYDSKVRLQLTRDSLDLIPYFNEPSLDGTFMDCKGLPVYIEVYTKGQVPGYNRKFRNAVPRQ